VEANIYGTPLLMWLVAFSAIVILGVSKGGIKGISVILVTMLVFVYGGRISTGILMPLLIAADLMAITYYRKDVKWKYLIMMMPAMVLGVVIGTLIGKNMPEEVFKKAMILIIIFSVLIRLYWEKTTEECLHWYCGMAIFHD